MDTTVYGIQVIRAPDHSVRRGDSWMRPSTIQLWKSWPDGAKCLTLELRADEVPERQSGLFDGASPWRRLHFEDGPRCTFDSERDWWIAPPSVAFIRLWTGSREAPTIVDVEPRRAP